MLAFKILTSENKDGLLAALIKNIPSADKEYLYEVAGSASTLLPPLKAAF